MINRPSNNVIALTIEAATMHGVSVCKKLHKPIKNITDFPTLVDWFEGFDQRLFKKFDGTSGPFSKELVEKANFLSRELLTSQTNTVLLHGDLCKDLHKSPYAKSNVMQSKAVAI